MEMEQMLKLIEAISESPLTEFQYDADGVKISLKKEQFAGEGIQPQVTLTKEMQPAKKEEQEPEGNIVKSPLVGTFYAAASEDAEPFVKIGDEVQKGQVLAIVEAMKLMNEIESDFSGKVAELYVANGETVEYGQPLFRIV